MPFVRFTRDRRGYENTYVLHSYRKRGKARQKILYWFRTPPHLKIGRAALDDETVRRLEKLNPALEFDWDKILDPQQQPLREAPAPAGRRKKGGGVAPAQRLPATPSRPVEVRPTPAAAGRARRDETELSPVEAPAQEEREPAAAVEAEPEPAETGAGLAPDLEAPPDQDSRDRLRFCFQQLRAVVAVRVQDPVRRATLEKEIEAFDPEAWSIEGDPAAVIADYEQRAAAFVRKIVGRRRRSRRRGGARRHRKSGGQAQAGAEVRIKAEQAPPDDSEPPLGGSDGPEEPF